VYSSSGGGLNPDFDAPSNVAISVALDRRPALHSKAMAAKTRSPSASAARRLRAPFAASVAGVLLFTGGLAWAPPAVASDLTGEWRGKVRCRANDGSRRTIPNLGAVVNFHQVGRSFVAQVEDSQGMRRYNGEVVSQIGRNQRVEAILVECRSTAALSNYTEKALLRGTISKNTASLSGTSMFRNQWGEIGTCRWRLQRVSKRVPSVTPCF